MVNKIKVFSRSRRPYCFATQDMFCIFFPSSFNVHNVLFFFICCCKLRQYEVECFNFLLKLGLCIWLIASSFVFFRKMIMMMMMRHCWMLSYCFMVFYSRINLYAVRRKFNLRRQSRGELMVISQHRAQCCRISFLFLLIYFFYFSYFYSFIYFYSIFYSILSVTFHESSNIYFILILFWKKKNYFRRRFECHYFLLKRDMGISV